MILWGCIYQLSRAMCSLLVGLACSGALFSVQPQVCSFLVPRVMDTSWSAGEIADGEDVLLALER